jgi:hypothetical protein
MPSGAARLLAQGFQVVSLPMAVTPMAKVFDVFSERALEGDRRKPSRLTSGERGVSATTLVDFEYNNRTNKKSQEKSEASSRRRLLHTPQVQSYPTIFDKKTRRSPFSEGEYLSGKFLNLNLNQESESYI